MLPAMKTHSLPKLRISKATDAHRIVSVGDLRKGTKVANPGAPSTSKVKNALPLHRG